MSKKYFINTYGCQMNVHESEKIAGILKKCGYDSAEKIEDADFIMLNTCAIRETAENRVVGNLGIIKKLKEKNRNLIVAVCGCMTQKAVTAQNLKKRCPFVDIIIGTHNIYSLDKYIAEAEAGKKVFEILESEGSIIENVPVYRTSGVNAWVNIMYGCNNFCTYCIVPYVKGRERSRDYNEVVGEVKQVIAEGYKEITLLGQNVNSYSNGQVNFAKLLEKILSLDGDFRLKFMTSHPKDISEEVVRVISQSDKAAKYIHLPLQSGSDRILKLMNRRYDSKSYLNKVDMIRKYMPNAGLSSDIIVGFPTETEQDFDDTMSLVEKVKFNNLYTFIYSRRSGTVADKMDGQIDIKIKTERIEKLIDRQFLIGNDIAEQCIGNRYKVLVESHKDGKCYGKTECDKAVSFDSSEDLTGKFVEVKITYRANNKLFAQLK